jgi:hypothetical protein
LLDELLVTKAEREERRRDGEREEGVGMGGERQERVGREREKMEGETV